MKEKDIENFETGESCFGDILRINGKDYEDLHEGDVIEFILDMLYNDLNKLSLRQEVLKKCLDYLQFDIEDSSSDTCEQCGNPNWHSKNVRPNE